MACVIDGVIRKDSALTEIDLIWMMIKYIYDNNNKIYKKSFMLTKAPFI